MQEVLQESIFTLRSTVGFCWTTVMHNYSALRLRSLLQFQIKVNEVKLIRLLLLILHFSVYRSGTRLALRLWPIRSAAIHVSTFTAGPTAWSWTAVSSVATTCPAERQPTTSCWSMANRNASAARTASGSTNRYCRPNYGLRVCRIFLIGTYMVDSFIYFKHIHFKLQLCFESQNSCHVKLMSKSELCSAFNKAVVNPPPPHSHEKLPLQQPKCKYRK